jgi:hypothetical protein
MNRSHPIIRVIVIIPMIAALACNAFTGDAVTDSPTITSATATGAATSSTSGGRFPQQPTPEPSSTVQHLTRPTSPPVPAQVIYDCSTGPFVTQGQTVQPLGGCESYALDLYERPFNADAQDKFYPDLDILAATLGRDTNWFYFQMDLFALRPEINSLTAYYGIEIDSDLDGRADYLIWSAAPTIKVGKEWGVDGVQVWADANNDVGNELPQQPDPPQKGNGFEQLLFNGGLGADPDAAWARIDPVYPLRVQIAFKRSLIGNAEKFIWRALSEQGNTDLSAWYHHDNFTEAEAGSPYLSDPNFPIKGIFENDTTCRLIFGADSAGEPGLCGRIAVATPGVTPSATQPPPTSTRPVATTPARATSTRTSTRPPTSTMTSTRPPTATPPRVLPTHTPTRPCAINDRPCVLTATHAAQAAADDGKPPQIDQLSASRSGNNVTLQIFVTDNGQAGVEKVSMTYTYTNTSNVVINGTQNAYFTLIGTPKSGFWNVNLTNVKAGTSVTFSATATDFAGHSTTAGPTTKTP